MQQSSTNMQVAGCNYRGLCYEYGPSRFCGAHHTGMCPGPEEVEYYPDGALKRVRLRQEPVQIQISVRPD